MPKVRIRVLRTDLALGERNSSVNNPIALAFARVFPGLRRHVLLDGAMIGGHAVSLPPRVRTFLRRWDYLDSRPSGYAPFGFFADCPKKLAAKARKPKAAAKRKRT